MKIYRVDFAANDYQSLFPTDESLWESGMLIFDGTRRIQHWATPHLFCLKPKLKRGDFFGGNVSALIAPEETVQRVRGFFREAGELLSVSVEGNSRPFTILNVTECINVLDQEKTEWL